METTAQLAARFDERAATYDDSAMHRGLAHAVADFVRLGGVRDVLDVGTGTGLVLRALPAGPWRLTGVGHTPGLHPGAQGPQPHSRREGGDATTLPLALTPHGEAR